MSATGLLLGVLNLFIVVVVLLLVGAVIEWLLRAIFDMAVTPIIRKLYLGFVALVALVLFVRLLLGVPLHLVYWE
jgi:hypothetical protein